MLKNIFNLHADDKLFASASERGATLRDGGYYAIDSLRVEKGYRAWGHELTPVINPIEAGAKRPPPSTHVPSLEFYPSLLAFLVAFRRPMFAGWCLPGAAGCGGVRSYLAVGGYQASGSR